LVSPEEAPGDHRYDCNVSKGIDGVNHFCSGGGKRRGARLHDIKYASRKSRPLLEVFRIIQITGELYFNGF